MDLEVHLLTIQNRRLKKIEFCPPKELRTLELLLMYSTLSNKRTGTNYRILRKNLDQGSVIIFDQ